MGKCWWLAALTLASLWQARNCTIRRAGTGLPPPAISTPDAFSTRRRYYPTARCWLLGAITAALPRAPNCTTRPAEPGLPPPTLSTPHAISTRRRYCPTARCWLLADLIVVPLLPLFTRAPNCTTRPAEPGPSPAISTSHAISTRRRCCPTARCWLLDNGVLTRSPNCTTLPAEPGPSPAISTPHAISTPPR